MAFELPRALLEVDLTKCQEPLLRFAGQVYTESTVLCYTGGYNRKSGFSCVSFYFVLLIV